MQLYTPNIRDIKNIQNEEKGYYFSSVFEIIIRKHGYLLHENNCDIAPFGFVSRITPLADIDIIRGVYFFEGPIHKSILEYFQIQQEECVVETLKIEGCALSAAILQYSVVFVKDIPTHKKDSINEPYVHHSQDPFWDKKNIFIQQFISFSKEWQPILYATVNKLGVDSKIIIGITNGRYILVGAPIFDLICFGHTQPELHVPYYSMQISRNSYNVEKWVLDNAKELFIKNNLEVLKIDTWPAQYKAALSIRHDYDRKISDRAKKNILEFYRTLGIRSTWFVLIKNYEQNFKNIFNKYYGHELSLHTTAHNESEFKEEMFFLEQHLECNIAGYTAHGGLGSGGYKGAYNFKWAINAKMQYGESLGILSHIPYTAVVIDQEIVKNTKQLIMPGSHYSLDVGMKDEQHALSFLEKQIPQSIKNGDYVIIMNHPDIHIEQLTQLLTKLNLTAVWCVNYQEMAEWYLSTHTNTYFKYDQCNNIKVVFPSELKHSANLNVYKNGKHYIFTIPSSMNVVNVKFKGENIEMSYHKDKLTIKESNQILTEYYEAIKTTIIEEHNMQGISEQATQGTITVNTTQLGGRAKYVLDLLDMTLNSNSKIAELGCGYGFLALGLHILSGAQISGYELNNTYIKVGQRFLSLKPELNHKISFQQRDIINQELPANEYDAVTINNALCYVCGSSAKIKFLQNAYNSLKKGGKIFIYDINLWCVREPFTKLYFVHWLPKGMQNYITKMFKKRHLNDVEYCTPSGCSRLLKIVGFKNCKIHFKQSSIKKKSTQYNTSYYTIVAEK